MGVSNVRFAASGAIIRGEEVWYAARKLGPDPRVAVAVAVRVIVVRKDIVCASMYVV